MTEQQEAELNKLRSLLRARDGKPGYRQNVEAIKARIAELQDQPASE